MKARPGDELTPKGLRQLHWAIRSALVAMGGKRGPGKADASGRPREKVRHSCLFHDDPHPSADFYPDDGWYYCFGCGREFFLDQIVAELRSLRRPEVALEVVGADAGIASAKKEARREDRAAEDRSHHHSKFGKPDAVYPYYHPVTRAVSHYKLRWAAWNDDGTPTLDEHQKQLKHIRTQGARGEWQNVVPTWPIFGDTTLWPGLNIIVCEGEKAVLLCTEVGELYNDSLIVAVTCGSNDALLQNGRCLADRLAELAPARVLLWPDNDKRRQTMRWITPLQRALEAHGVTVGRVDLQALGLPAHAGPDDFLALGGRLADVFGATFLPAGAPTLDRLVHDTVMTRDGRVLVPGTRRLVEPKAENLEAIWYRHTGGQVPKAQALKLLRAGLLSRSFDSRVQVAHRRWHDAGNTCLYWRPYSDGFCYRVDKDGVITALDPPETLLMVEDDARFDPAVDESGTMDDLEEMCAFFGLDARRAALLLGWLCCALVGLETPILMLRGESGAGKTTLAHLLMAVLEPGVPHMNLPSDQRFSFDSRQFVETLRRASGVVVDNVTRLSAEAEDLLSQVVTGYGVSQRRLNTHDIETLNMRRAVIITTIHWDVKRGDLATRLLPLHLEDHDEYIPKMEIRSRFEPLVRRIRGLVFQAAQEFYERCDATPKRTHIRVADLGFMLSALGYDGPELSGLLHRIRSDVMAETDYWVDAVRDMYRSRYQDGYPAIGDYFLASSLDVVTHMVDHGCENVPSHRSPALARWLRERNPVFKDSGFVVEYFKSTGFRGWKFKTIRWVERDEE